MFRRKIKKLGFVICIFFLLACGNGTLIEECIEINKGESYSVSDVRLNEYEGLLWESEDVAVAEVKNGVITACAPGETKVYAKNNGIIVAEYSIIVESIPIKDIILSVESCELTEGDTYQIWYTLFPEYADDSKLEWKSANEAIVSVDAEGTIIGISSGQTKVVVTNSEEIIASCLVTVNPGAAYERLSEKEKTFVDDFLRHIDSFKNPDSVVIKAVTRLNAHSWSAKISAENGFGAITAEVYNFSSDYLFESSSDAIYHSELYNLDLINEAIKEKR